MRLFCATVSCHWKLSRLFVFPPFTSLSYSSFFHSYISFSAGHFLPSQVLPRLFAGMKDVVTLRCSQDPRVTGRQWKILSFHFHAFLLQSDSTASADPHLPCQRELICFPCLFKLIKVHMFNKETSPGLYPKKDTNGKGRIWTGSCQRETALFLCLAPFFATSIRILLCKCHA